MNRKFVSVLLSFVLMAGVLPLDIGNAYADLIGDQGFYVEILNEDSGELINKVQLESVIKNENGDVVAVGDELETTTATMQVQLSDIAIAWESLTPTIATVDSDGEVTRVADGGEAMIKASLVSDASNFDTITLVIADNVEDMDAELELVKSELANESTFDYQGALCYNIMGTSDVDIARIADKLDTGSEPTSATSYGKFIMGLVAAHEDPRDYNGKDYVAELEALIGESGNFGSSYTTSAARAMLALDMVGSDYDKAKTINYLLSMQDEASGGFELSSSRGVDLSATGLILSALSRYYGESVEGVMGLDAAVDAAVANLMDVETESAGFISMGGENISALETAVTALAGLGVDLLNDVDWIKESTTVYHKLLSFKDDDVYGSDKARAFAVLTALKNTESVYTLVGLKDKNVYIQNDYNAELTDTMQLEAVVKDSTGNILADESLVWESLTSEKSTVDANGLVKSVSDTGTSLIKVSLACDATVFDVIQLINGEPEDQETPPVTEEEGMDIEIAIIGKQISETDTEIRYEVIFGPQTVTLDEDTQYGYTALGALDATGLNYTVSSSGMVKSISSVQNQGIGGWKYEKNEQAPGVLAINNIVENNDRVMWYYCEEGMSGTAPDWPRNGSYAVVKKDAVNVAGLTDEAFNSLSDASKSLEERTELAEELIQGLEGNSDEKKLELAKTIADTLLGSIDNVAPGITIVEGKTVVKIEYEELCKQIRDISTSLEMLETVIKEIGIESLEKLEIEKEVAVEIEESLSAMELSIPKEAMQILADKGLNLVIKTGDMGLSIPPSLLSLGSIVGTGIKLTARKVDGLPVEDAALGNSGLKEMLPRSPVYDFNLYGELAQGITSIHEFDKEITIELSLGDLNFESINSDQLGVYYLNEITNQWEYAGGTADTENKKIVFKTNHFSLYTVMEHKQTFEDIQNHWAKQYIEAMALKGICKGVNATSFAPDRSITRAEFATLVCKTLDLEASPYGESFSDVHAGDWYGGFVQTCMDQNIFSGYNGMFRPNDVITREEMACVIVKALGRCEKELDAQTEVSLLRFSDSESVSPWAQTSIEKVLSLQIMSGMSEREFAPKATATRAQAIVVLNKVINE